MQVEQDPVPHLIDCLARLIADHLHLFAADEQVTLSLHRLLVRLLRECPNCNYCNLVADALNDFHNNLSVHYEALKLDCRELLEVLVQRAVLPDAFFTPSSSSTRTTRSAASARAHRTSCSCSAPPSPAWPSPPPRSSPSD